MPDHLKIIVTWVRGSTVMRTRACISPTYILLITGDPVTLAGLLSVLRLKQSNWLLTCIVVINILNRKEAVDFAYKGFPLVVVRERIPPLHTFNEKSV